MTLAVAGRPLSPFAIHHCGKLFASSSNNEAGHPVQRLERRLGIVGFAASALLLAASLRWFAVGPPNTLAWYSYGASVILLLLALPTFERRWSGLILRLRERPQVSLHLKTLLVWAALAGILILALAVRLFDLQDLPAGVWYDEAANLSEARQIQQDPGSTPVFARVIPTFYLMPAAVLINLVDVTPAAIRLVSVMFSLAGMVAVFFLVRQVLGTYPALLAAFLLAIMRWDINFSRIGMIPVTMSLTTALTAYLTLRALRSGRISDFGYAGAALGFGMWLYASFYLFPLVIGFILIHYFLAQRPQAKHFAARLVIMGVVALAVAAPLVQFAVIYSEVFFARTKATNVFSIMPLDEALRQVNGSLGKHVLMFNYQGDSNPRHNLPNAPMLDFLSGILLMLGLGIALGRWRNVALVSLPLWVLFMAMPGALTLPSEAPQALRAIGVIPAIVVLITLVFGIVWAAGRSAPWQLVRRGTPVVLALVLGVIAFVNVNTYFGEQASHPEVFASFTTDEVLMGQHMLEQQRRGYTMLVSRHFQFSVNRALFAGDPRVDVIRAPESIPIAPSRVWLGASVYLEPREESFYRLLRLYYPDARFEEVRPPGGGKVLFYSVVISREQLVSRQGLLARYTFVDGSARETIQDTTEGVWLLDIRPQDVPFDLVWEGVLHVTQPGEYLMSLEGDVAVEVWLDGRLILRSSQRTVRIDPAVGIHSLEIKGIVEDRADVLRLLWQPPGGELEAIPTTYLYHGSVRPLGLAGRFHEIEEGLAGDPSAAPTDSPAATRLTPAMDTFWYNPVVPEPYLAVWEGTLDVRADDSYRFKLDGSGTVKLILDGTLRAQHPGTRIIGPEERVTLRAGKHLIRVECFSSGPPSQIEVLWGRSGQGLEPIPIELLLPNPERMFRVADGE